MTPFLKGSYHDLVTNARGQMLWDSGWRSNLVVQGSNVLLAALMKRQEGIRGILYWAIGEGEASWDAAIPTPQFTTTQLTGEIARQALDTDQIVYLDHTNRPTTTSSNRLEIVTQFNGEDLVSDGFQSLREFGLFGGEATGAPNSGCMIDYVIHPRIDMTPGMRLHRRLRLTFGASKPDTIGEGGQAGLWASLPVISIDGVGQAYANGLSAQGISTLGDLAEINPLNPVSDIPQGKLREFCAKARMAMSLQIGFFPVQLIADRSVSSVLRERPEHLVRIIGTPGVDQEMVVRLQGELDKLQVALDDMQLQNITLGNLMNVDV